MNTPRPSYALTDRLAELKSLVETARRSLLDAVVLVDEVGKGLGNQGYAADEFGVLAPESNHEDYVPGDADRDEYL